VRRRATVCYVAVDVETAKVAGYYTLAAASIAEFGGRYAVRGGDPKVLEGTGPAPRSVHRTTHLSR